MTTKSEDGGSNWTDPDDAPELTDAFFETADVYRGETLVRRGRGRPPSSQKQMVTLRLDTDIIERFRATGPGWQTRINDALRRSTTE